MILSLPEIEFDVMSVSSSSAVIAGACPSAIASGSRSVAAASALSVASRWIRVTRLVGARNRNTYMKYGSMITRPNTVAARIANTVARGTNSECSPRLANTPTQHVTT